MFLLHLCWHCLQTTLLTCAALLQANLPLLQRELLHCARLAKQNPAQYLAQHEQLLLDASTTSPVDSSELLLDVNENGKRRTPDRWAPPTFPILPRVSVSPRCWAPPAQRGVGGYLGGGPWVPSVQPGRECFWRGTSTTSPGNLCQCLTTFRTKNFFLLPSLNLFSY